MKKHLTLLTSSLVVMTLLASAIWPAVSSAFNGNNLMDDSIFNNTTSMNGDQINTWLNANFPSSCISPRNGFSSPDPTGYNPSAGFTYGGNVTAGQVVYDAGQAYGLNPQVLLATLQKESSVVTGDASYHCQYINTAMGYGCPDSGNCPTNPATMSGFSKQVIHAAWLFKFGQQRSLGNTGWNIQSTNFPQAGDRWDNSDDPPTTYSGPMTQGVRARVNGGSVASYDGYTTIDGTSTHMDSGATAALYWYTPHFSGNQNFDNIFNAWFGTIYGNTIGSSAYRLYNPTIRHHYFTASENDRASAKQKGYNDDVIGAFNVGSTQQAGMVPIYALYNGRMSDNWLLPDGGNLYWAAIYGGYGIQRVAFYAYPANPNPTSGNPLCPAGSVPVYQMWNGGLTEHFYSIHGVDHWWALVQGGYVNDGSSAYIDSNGGVSFCVPQ